MLSHVNIADGETVHQRCLLIVGQCQSSDNGGIMVSVRDEAGKDTLPPQHWPLASGHFKALVFLSPGINVIGFMPKGQDEFTMSVNYVPLLQTPPLHLAILVASDSPLMIDCPPNKYGDVSNAHSNLEAAIAKFRMTAYMWQALTAADMHAKGLGRRSFRLDERWGFDTISRGFSDAQQVGGPKMQSTAHIHVIKTAKTVAELRNMQLAQQNPIAHRKNELHQIFSNVLKVAGVEFDPGRRPVVAGLILDSHYSAEQDLVLAHAALGSHSPKGLSLGIMGSHLTYSWPRFVEEVASCLSDTREPGEQVCNDNGECLSMWEACAVGQGAFLHEVGHAFSASHTSGIMSRGYSQDWPKCFLARTAQSKCLAADGVAPVTSETPNDCCWDLRDAVRFLNLPHFALPMDQFYEKEGPKAELINNDDDNDEFLSVKISGPSSIIRARVNGKEEPSPNLQFPEKMMKYTLDELQSRYDHLKPLKLEVLCMNGTCTTFDLWNIFADAKIIRIPGTSIHLIKSSVADDFAKAERDSWSWAVMLKKRSAAGHFVRASKVDLRVGCSLDGAIVHYKDGTQIPCGPRGKTPDQDPGMGGHQARKLALPAGDEIVKVQVTCSGDYPGSNELRGLRMHLASGKAMGALNNYPGCKVTSLEPPSGHCVVGFFGKSGRHGMCNEFGIISAPNNVELPDSMYDMAELQNTNGRTSRDAAAKLRKPSDDHQDLSEDECTSEDEDSGYDYVGDDDDDDNSVDDS